MAWVHQPHMVNDPRFDPRLALRFQEIQESLDYILQQCVLPPNDQSRPKDEKPGCTPNFPFESIANVFLHHNDPEYSIDLVTEILEFLPDYNISRPSGHLYTHGSLTKSTPVAPLVFSVLFRLIAYPDPNDSGARGGRTKKDKKRPPRMCLRHVSDDQATRIFEALLPLDFPVEAKILNRAGYILNLKDRIEMLRQIAVTFVLEGKASFASTIFLMHNDSFSRFFTTAEPIRVAMCLGPLRATTVEYFASGRSPPFRAQCRAVLEDAMKTVQQRTFQSFCPPCLLYKYGDARFYDHVPSMISELKGEQDHDPLINSGWAFAAIKKHLKKRYVDKEWATENLHDLLWTIIYQRPTLRRATVKFLKEYDDDAAATYWQKVSTKDVPMERVPNDVTIVTGNPLDPQLGQGYLLFPPEVREIVFVDTPEALQRVDEDLVQRVEKSEKIIVALDAEWSAYQSFAAASILQIGLHDVAYIIDLDHLPSSALHPFMHTLFSDGRILKLGFQFTEDLTQMKMAKNLRGCAPLYRPMNLVCILRLVLALIREAERRPDGQDLLEEFGLRLDDKNEAGEEGEDNLDDSGVNDCTEGTPDDGQSASRPAPASNSRTPTKQLSSYGGENNQNNNSSSPLQNKTATRSLSSICECMLGLPLDKKEQCSVWTRRPLRTLQLRYAAMDAHCLLMLYEKCSQWAERMEVQMDVLVSKQAQPPSNLPLMIGD